MKTLDILAIGELLADCTEEGTGWDGYPVLATHPGGAPANFLAAATKYGAKTALFGAVGDDAFGRRLVRTLEETGIDTSLIRETKEAFTTLALVTRDEHGEREFSFVRKPGADIMLRPEDIDPAVLDGVRMLHFGTLSQTDEPARSTHEFLIAEAKKRGVLISLDPNLRETIWDDLEEAKERMLWSIAQADVIKISDSEINFLFGLDPAEGAAKLFEIAQPKLVFVTCGKEGACFRNRNAEGMVRPQVEVSPVDTTGAGDIFGGSAMQKILRTGKDPQDLNEEELRKIVSFACTAASLSTTKLGGLVSVPEEAEVVEVSMGT